MVTARSNQDSGQRGGGHATTAGINFEAMVGASFAVRLLAERPVDGRLQIQGGEIRALRFETEAPIDDILVETERGWIFIQAKTTLALSSGPEAELAKVAEQFVRQWFASSTGDGSRGWNRPLNRDSDRFVLAISSQASKSISINLAQGLEALHRPRAGLPATRRDAINTFSKHIERAWMKVTGQRAGPEDVKAILSLASILTFDFEGADLVAATEMLSHVLEPSANGIAAFSAVTQACLVLMKERSGCDVESLRSELVASGVPLTAPPSYREDVAKLRAYSDHIREQLSDYEVTSIDGRDISIERQCTPAVIKAAREGSLLLVGEPGAGKSAVISATAAKLRHEGFDVIELAVDRLPVKSSPELSQELGLAHPLRKVLQNWPGNEPGFLFIDALDATRGGENELVFRTLIEDVLRFDLRKWHIVASIRTFDLRLGEQFRRLFNGAPPSPEFSDSAFPKVTHVLVPHWTPSELDVLLQKAPSLQAALNSGGQRLRDLALVPFNTRLIADLLASGVAPSDFGAVDSQVRLLDLYWTKRISSHGTGAELCLKAAVGQMISSRSLRARKLTVAEPDAAAFDQLLYENVLIPLRQQHLVGFRHHILFDYAASRLYFSSDDIDEVVSALHRDNGVGLMLAPALAFALQELWRDDETRHTEFWEAIVQLAGNPSCDPVARSVAARIASELPSTAADVDGLLTALTEAGGLKTSAAKAFTQLVGALLVRFEDRQPVTLDPWCYLADRASEAVSDFPWTLRTLLFALYERTTSKQQKDKIGRAGRRLLEFGLDSEQAQLTAAAIDFVAETYSSDVMTSRLLLRRLFEPEHFQEYADQEIPWLTRRLNPICEADPDFLIEIYTHAFTGTIVDTSATSMGGGQILPLVSNRRQDFEMSLWSLKEFFPHFLKAKPTHATQALIKSMEGYVSREHPDKESQREAEIRIEGGRVRLREDRSYIWAWNVNQDHGHNAEGLILAFAKHLSTAKSDDARLIVRDLINSNELAIIWSRTLMVAAQRPDVLGDLLWPIATKEPFLTSLDTRKDAIDLIAARYKLETVESRQAFERSVIEPEFFEAARSPETRQWVLAPLLTAIGADQLETAAAREVLQNQPVGPEPNKRPFEIVSTSGSPDPWWWLEEDGVDLDDPTTQSILTKADEIKDALRLDGKESEVEDLSRALELVVGLLDSASTNSSSLPARVLSYTYGIAAQGAAKVSRASQEALRERPETVNALVALLIRLAELPAEPCDHEQEASFESSASWGSPDLRVETAEAVMQICRLGGDVVEKLRNTIERLLITPNPAARMQIADRLTVFWNTDRSLMWGLADRIVRSERNRGVLRFFANYFLSRTVHADPEQVERLVFELNLRDFSRSDEATKSLLNEIGSLVGLLWISHGRERAERSLQDWISDPFTYEPELSHAVSVSREALTLRYRDEDTRTAGITRRSQQFVRWTVDALASRLEDYLGEPSTERTQTGKDRATVWARLLNQLCNEIYFASGAFRSSAREKPSLKSIEEKRAFLWDTKDILQRIADVGTPGTIHHLLELLDFLLPADPPTVFDLVAHALLGAGRQHNYQFESLGADRFVEIVGHCLADHRELFLDEERRQKLVACLDTFLEAGWPSARRLLYRLPDLLQ